MSSVIKEEIKLTTINDFDDIYVGNDKQIQLKTIGKDNITYYLGFKSIYNCELFGKKKMVEDCTNNYAVLLPQQFDENNEETT